MIVDATVALATMGCACCGREIRETEIVFGLDVESEENETERKSICIDCLVAGANLELDAPIAYTPVPDTLPTGASPAEVDHA